MENNKLQVSTQIRTFYADGMSCMTIKFYNSNLSFQLYPFSGKDQNGMSKYDTKHGQQTTVNTEGAYALYKAAEDIINGKINETNLSVPCFGASLQLERKLSINGQMETVFSITKNNVTIPFRFQTLEQQVKENGQIVTKTVESGLGSFMKTIEGYLTGINAERHLNKLTDEFAKIQESKQPNQNQYRPNNNFKKPFNQNQQYRPKQNNWGGPAQPMNNYQFPNN